MRTLVLAGSSGLYSFAAGDPAAEEYLALAFVLKRYKMPYCLWPLRPVVELRMPGPAVWETPALCSFTKMPIVYQIDDANGFVLAVGHGVLTHEDMRTYLTQRESAPLRTYRQLFDLTAMTTGMSTEEMRDLVRRRRSLATPPAPIAFAIADDNLFAMFRIMQTMTETLRPIGVFRTLDEAQKWLENCLAEEGCEG